MNKKTAINKKVFRVHYTCEGRHTTYQDYKTKKYAFKQLIKCSLDGWWVTCIEIMDNEKNTDFTFLENENEP